MNPPEPKIKRPTVADAEAIADQLKADSVLIVSFHAEQFGVASFGRSQNQIDFAALLAERIAAGIVSGELLN